MLVAVFADTHAHAEALDAVIAAADAHGADELWSLGDMIGRGPNPEHAVTVTRARCRVALAGNHDYGATGSVDPARFGPPGSPGHRSVELARERLAADDVAWLRGRRPAARRDGVQCWHGSPRNAVHEYVGPSNATACLAAQRAPLGLVGHTHVAAAWRAAPGGRAQAVTIAPDAPLELGDDKWLLNPGAVGAPEPSRLGWWAGLESEASAGARWIALDLAARTATWRRRRTTRRRHASVPARSGSTTRRASRGRSRRGPAEPIGRRRASRGRSRRGPSEPGGRASRPRRGVSASAHGRPSVRSGSAPILAVPRRARSPATHQEPLP